MSRLHQKVQAAYIWTFAGNLVRQFVSFGLSLLLARLLHPSDYGLVGMVAVFVTFLTALQDLGLGRAVIYFDEAESGWATFCTVSTATGLLLSLAMFLSAPLLARFYSSPALVPIVHWLSLTLFLGGLRSASQSRITKQLLFQKITIIEGLCGLASAAIAVYLAWRGFGVWSLVTNLVLSSALNTLLVLFAAPPAFTLHLDWQLLKKVLRWGMPLTGSTLCWSFYDNADELIVGKLASSEQLGFYSLAFRLATLVNERIGALVSRVSFPAFAALQNDVSEVVRHWLAVTRKSALVSFPLLAILAIEAPDFVSVVLSPRWLPVVAPLRLLCVVGAIRVLTPIVVNLLPALGRSDLAFYYTLINTTVMPLSFFIGCRAAGIIGVGWAWVLVFPFIAFGLIRKALALTGVSWRAYLSNLSQPFIGTLALAAVMLPCLCLLPAGFMRMVLSPTLGCLAYLAAARLASYLDDHLPTRARFDMITRFGQPLRNGRLKIN